MWDKKVENDEENDWKWDTNHFNCHIELLIPSSPFIYICIILQNENESQWINYNWIVRGRLTGRYLFFFCSFTDHFSIWQFCTGVRGGSIGRCLAITWSAALYSIEPTEWHRWTNKYNGQNKCTNISTSCTSRWIGLLVRISFDVFFYYLVFSSNSECNFYLY